MTLSRQHLFAVLLVCFSMAAALVLGEAILRFARPSSYYIWAPHFTKVFKPYQDVMPGIAGDSVFAINSNGVRGDELTPAHTYRVLAIGGSTTECLYLDQSEAWPYLSQKALNQHTPTQNVWVGNAGKSGRTTRHHLMAIQYLPLKELRIDTIVLLIGYNDLVIRLSQNELYDPNFLAKPEATELLLAETFPGSTRPSADGPFFKNTATWRLLMKVKGIVLQREADHNTQDEAGRVYVTWRKHRQQASEIRNELPDLTSALGEYARNIHKMIDIAQQRSVRLIFMTQPTMYSSRMPENLEALLWSGGIGPFQKESGKPYYSAGALEKGIDRYNATLLGICQERGVECLDLASMLEKDTTVFYDDAHFNESGARKIATALANYMLGQDSFRELKVGR